jgi:voltage-gated potassium channel
MGRSTPVSKPVTTENNVSWSTTALARFRKLCVDAFRDLRELIVLARKEKLSVLLAWLFTLMIGGSIVFYFAEARSNPAISNYFDALYWSVISVTTVGYGDITPASPAGRTGSMVMVLSFMALMPLVGATITSIYVSKKLRGGQGLDTVTCTDHIIICGWNNNVNNVLKGLESQQERGMIVIVGELDPDHFEDVANAHPLLNFQLVRGPFNTAATLRRANVRHARVAFVMVRYDVDSLKSSDEDSVLAVLGLRELGPNVRIVAECFASGYRGHLRRAGADRVIVSGELDSFMLTAAALSPGLDTSIKSALTFGSENVLWTAAIPREFIGRTFQDLAVYWMDERCWILLGLIEVHRQLAITEVLSGESSNIDEFILTQFELAGRGKGGAQHMQYLNPGPDRIITEKGPGNRNLPGGGLR